MESIVQKFECDPEGFLAWLNEQARRLKIRAEVISMSQVRASWTFTFTNLVIDGITSLFFGVVGVEANAETSNREVRRWQQLMLKDQGGEVGLIVDEDDNVLVRARPEPGQRGVMIDVDGAQVSSRVLAGPPAQFSLANLAKHGPDKVPFANLLTDSTPNPGGGCTDIRPKEGIRRVPQEADGGRFFEKTNFYSIIRVNRDAFDKQLATRSDAVDFAWIDLATARAVRWNGCFSEHLSIAMGGML